MADYKTIEKYPQPDKSSDYAFLRGEGIKHIEKLAGDIWSDYNTHDPGITILELLCYAITDLGYRTSYHIKDILEEAYERGDTAEDSFFTAAEILTTSPLNMMDYRKLIADIKGIKNAWLVTEGVKDYQDFYCDYEKESLVYEQVEGQKAVPLRGLYNVLLEYEQEGANLEEEVRDLLNANRGLSEDFVSITEVDYEDIAVCADIEVKADADIESVLAEIYHILDNYFSPPINFYSLQEMIDTYKTRGKGIEEVFEGPLLCHGFIDSEEMEEADLRKELRVSDIINLIMDIVGVVAVKSILLTSYVKDKSGKLVIEEADREWVLNIKSRSSAPRLARDKSKFTFYKDILPYIANRTEVEKKYKALKESGKKYRLSGHDTDLPIPRGVFRDIETYHPVQHDFPLNYGIGEVGLADSESPSRKAKAKQLKGYLLFFEQILSGYLSQLANVKKLFSISADINRTYFMRELELGTDKDKESITDIKTLFLNTDTYKNKIHDLVEDDGIFLERRNRFLDHLLGRFSESLTDYGLLLGNLMEKGAKKELIKDKIAFLSEYPVISSERGKAFNYKYSGGVWETGNVSGMKKRISRLLGFNDYKRRNFSNELIRVIKKSGKKYAIKLYASLTPPRLLMVSIDYPDQECAEGILQYMLAYGDNPERYRATETNGKYYFNFTNKCDEVIAVSKGYATEAEMTDARSAAIDFFTRNTDIEGFHIIEHILLRPKDRGFTLPPVAIRKSPAKKDNALTDNCAYEKDPYSFRISVLLPAWPEVFRNLNFRRFIEKTIREETPAHIFPRICWIDMKQMKDLETAYKDWLIQMAENGSDDDASDITNSLLETIYNLKNVYPVATLHDCDDTGGDDPQVTLDHTTIGVL